ncbi:MAG: KH domain-containing protein, partial [Elusimicrobiota bacterium]
AGKDLRRLTERSRAMLEQFLGRKVNLELWIKVRKNWRRDPRALKEFGYST